MIKTEAKNLQAILDWVEKNRPDCLKHVEQLVNNDGFILIMTMAFEAGRTFQKANPKAPMGSAAYI